MPCHFGPGLCGWEQAEHYGRHDSGACDGRSVREQKGWGPAVRMAPPLGPGLAARQWQRARAVELGRGAHCRHVVSSLGWEHWNKVRKVRMAGAADDLGMALYTGCGSHLQVFSYSPW